MGTSVDAILFFSANPYDSRLASDADETLEDWVMDLQEIAEIVKLPAQLMLKFEGKGSDPIEMEVYGNDNFAAGNTISQLLYAVPLLYKKGLIKTCEITTVGVEAAQYCGLTHTSSIEKCVSAGVPMIFQNYRLNSDEQKSIRAGLKGLRSPDQVARVHLQTCDLDGDHGTSPLVKIDLTSTDEKYRNNFALSLEGMKASVDMETFASGVQLGLYYSLSLKSTTVENVQDFLKFVSACQQKEWKIQVGVSAASQEKWVKKTLILDNVKIEGAKVDQPWLLFQESAFAYQMELVLDGSQVDTRRRQKTEFESLKERIQAGQLFLLYSSHLV